ncbi:MAG TPA: TonB-dependent receptor [Pedomonas sp.]|uniref:TonB-dependent receptor n=1 Tax=Pedomonas sp. TaxID=2976421 RepID=UPI002F416E36
MAVIFSFGSAGASAQNAAADAPAPNTGLGDIIVTARKKDESIIQAPVAISALSADALEARGISNYSDLSDFVPGFRYQNQSVNRNDRGYTFFTVRGMFSGTPSPDRQGASAFIDGVPVGGGAISGLTDIERVEVIKGPQSAYFGRATFAGAVNFITRTPSFEPRLNGSMSYSSYDTSEFKVSAEGGLIEDVLSARISARLYDTDGQYDNYGYDGKLGAQETRSIAGTVYFTPTADLKVRGYINYWEDRDGPSASGQLQREDFNCTTSTGVAFYCGALGRGLLNRLTQQVEVGRDVIDRVNGATPPSQYSVKPGFNDDFGMKRNSLQTHIIADYSFANGYTLSANGSYLHDQWGYVADTGFIDGRNTPNPFYGTRPNVLPYYSRTVGGQTDLTNHSTEVRLSSPGEDRFNWLAGFNYFRQRNSIATNAFANAGFSQSVPATTYSADTYALFGSASYDITEALNFSLEGRYQWDEIGQTVESRNINYQGKSKSFNPRAILRYEFDSETSAYVSYAKGTRPGQFNATLLALPQAVQDQVQSQLSVPATVGTEKIEMGELGFKANLLDRRLQLLTAFYYGTWYDKHINQSIVYNNPTPQTVRIVVPGGEVELYGAEIEATFRASDYLTLEGTLSYAETKIKNTQCAECGTLIGDSNPVGNRLPQYSAWTGSASATYARPVTEAVDGFLRIDYFYTGRQYESEANVAWLKPSHRFNARIGVDSGQLNFELFAENLFNSKVPTSIAYNADTYTGMPSLTFSPARRRVFGARMGFEF